MIHIIIDFNGYDYCDFRCFPKDDCVLKSEPCFEQDKCAVSWHADSTLHHFSSIGVYQFIDDEVVVDDVDDDDGNNDGVNDDDQWRLALRVWYDAEGPNASKAISSRSHEMRTMMELMKNNNNNNNSKAQSSSSSSSSSSSCSNIKDNIIDENKYNKCDDRKDYNQKKKTNKKRKIDYGDDDKNIGIINDNLHDNNHHNDDNNRLNINSDDDDDDNSNKVSVPMIAPSLAVPLPHNCCYFLLDDFNHHHQHAVLAGSVFLFFLSLFIYNFLC